MTFNRRYARVFGGARPWLLMTGVLPLCFVFAVFPYSATRAEPQAEAFHPSSPALAGDQSRFEEGVHAYDAGDYGAAFAIWLPLAKAGDLAAQRNVAHLLRRGVGVEADPIRALYFYERAARSGLASAALNAGMMRLEQDADYFDPRKAAEWLSLSAAAGSPIAQWELSRLLESGEGGTKDPEGALLLLQQAAAAGHKQAKVRLEELRPPPVPTTGQLDASPVTLVPPVGEATPVSPETGAVFMVGKFQFEEGEYAEAAATWLPLAEKGILEAQYRLGRLYQFGMGVPRDPDTARRWLKAARDGGHEGARKALAALPSVSP